MVLPIRSFQISQLVRTAETPPKITAAQRLSELAVLATLLSAALPFSSRLGRLGSLSSYALAGLALGLAVGGCWLNRKAALGRFRLYLAFLFACLIAIVWLLLRLSLSGSADPNAVVFHRRVLFLILPIFGLATAGLTANLTGSERHRLARIACVGGLALALVSLDNRLTGHYAYTITGASRFASGTQVYAALVAVGITALARRLSLMLIAISCFCVVALFAVQRSAYVAVLVFLTMIVLGRRSDHTRSHTNKRRNLQIASVTLIALPVALLTLWMLAAPLTAAVQTQLTRIPIAQDGNAQFRFTAWRTQRTELSEFPLLGVGAGGSIKALDQTGVLAEVDSHNSELTVLWRLGWPLGLCFLAVLIIPPLRIALGKRMNTQSKVSAALVISGSVLGFVNVVLELPYAAAPLWLAYGLMIQSFGSEEHAEEETSPAHRAATPADTRLERHDPTPIRRGVPPH